MASINEVHRELGNLRGTLDTFIAELREKHERDDIDKTDTEKRLRSVERKQYWLTGVFSGLSFFASTILHRFNQPTI